MAKKNFVSYGDSESLFAKIQERLGLRPKTWSGTTDEWNELTLAEKKSYDRADILDDSESGDVDTIPTENSPNLITSGGVYTALSEKQNTLTFDNTPTANSNNPVKSGGVYSANQNIYEVMGKNGAKNLLPNIGASNTINGITYTVNEDGSVLLFEIHHN